MGTQGKFPSCDIAWERILIRHVVKGKRDDLDRLDSLLRAPFESNSSFIDHGGSDLHLLGKPKARWMMAARFTKNSWVTLTSNTGTAEDIFEANSSSRRLEVLWLGCVPEGNGWFFKFRRGGKSIIEFSQPVEADSEPTFKAIDDEADLLDDCHSGEQAFGRLCSHFDIELLNRQIHATNREFQLIGARGKPVKTGLWGYILIKGPEIAKDEDQAATNLAKAIERCDIEAMRKAIERGASVNVLPDTSVSPLESILFKCEKPGWEACAKLLLQHGAPVDGLPHGDPPIINCAQSFISESMGLKMLKFLVANGADVNGTDSSNETALFKAVIQGYVDIIQFLMEHDADPNIETSYGRSAAEWLRSRLDEDCGITLRTKYAQLLNLLTGETIEEPDLPELSNDLKSENERFRLYHKARFCLEFVPEDVDFQRIKVSRVANIEPFEAWQQELLDTEFELSGHFVQRSPDRVTGSAYTNSKLGFDATLSSGGNLGNDLRCDIAAHHPDETVSVTTNYTIVEDPDFSVRWLEYNEQLDASPAQLVSSCFLNQ